MATHSPALAAVLSLLDAEDYYSAHQKARTTATRLLSSRTGPTTTTFDKKATEAANLLWEAGRRLLEKGQVGSGVDLATYLVEVWKARGVECGEEQRGEWPSVVAGSVGVAGGVQEEGGLNTAGPALALGGVHPEAQLGEVTVVELNGTLAVLAQSSWAAPYQAHGISHRVPLPVQSCQYHGSVGGSFRFFLSC